MKRFVFIARIGALHHLEAFKALCIGSKRFNIGIELIQRTANEPFNDFYADCVFMWGMRDKAIYEYFRNKNVPVIVVEAGFLGERVKNNRVNWYSLGLNGLNGLAKWPSCHDSGERLNSLFPDALENYKPYYEKENIALLGQVPGDSALNGFDLSDWLNNTYKHYFNRNERILYRPHPQASFYPNNILKSDLTLKAVFASSKKAVGISSNALVLAALYGIPVCAASDVCMTNFNHWQISTKNLDEYFVPSEYERLEWARNLAWCQWKKKELMDGSALAVCFSDFGLSELI